MKPIMIPEHASVDPGPGRVLVRVASAVEGKYGPLILPATGDERKFFGRVEALPTHYIEGESELSWLKEGDLVFFGKYSGTQLQLNRDTYIICKETDILARVSDNSAQIEAEKMFGEMKHG